MSLLSTQIEKDLILPDLPKDKCVNHPTRQAIKRMLCAGCLEAWEKSVLEYEVWESSATEAPTDRNMKKYVERANSK